MRYVPGQFSRFFYRKDWNLLAQEITTVVLGVGVGLYCYEKKALPGILRPLEWVPGSQVLAQEDHPFLTAGLVMIGVAAFIKVLIYIGLLDLNALKSGKKRSRHGININGILQEILTVLLGFAIGLFTTPVVKNAVLFEQSEYPDPIPGITLALGCILMKTFLYAGVFNFNLTGRLIQPSKLGPFLSRYDWNHFVQEATSTCIGIGIGLYMYQSGLVFVLGDFGNKLVGKAQEEAGSILERIPIFGSKAKELALTPLWSNEQTQPYLVAGLVVIGICVLLKLLIYCSLWDANRMRDGLLGSSGRSSGHYGIDAQGIADEIVTFLITIVLGIVTAPLAKNAMLDDKDPHNFLLGGGILLAILCWVKLALITGALRFGSYRKK